MKKAIDQLQVEPESLLIDGNYFKPYVDKTGELIPHECFVKGDDKFDLLVTVSILAKVDHDDYIENLVKNEPELEKYDWLNNMCYGTQKHINAIKEHGIS